MVTQVEPELLEETPRPVRMTSAGARRLVLSTVPIATATTLGLLLLVSGPRPRWLAALFAFVSLAGVGGLYVVISRWLLRVRLVERGVAVASRIVAKESWRRGSAHYYCWYEAGGKKRGLGWAGRQNDLEIGDIVTVLYLQNDPDRAVAYPWAGCKVAPRRARVRELQSAGPRP